MSLARDLADSVFTKATSFDNGITVTGTIDSDAITTSDDLTFTNADPKILGGDADGRLFLTASTTINLGGNMVLYGDTHATRAGDLSFRTNTTERLAWDFSESLWDFSSYAIQTTGTLASGALTVTGATNTSSHINLNTATVADGYVQIKVSGHGATITNDGNWGATQFYSTDASGMGAGLVGSVACLQDATSGFARGKLVFSTANRTSQATPVNALVIDSFQNVSIPNGDLSVTGNLGIGDSSPVDQLTVSRLGNTWAGVAPSAGSVILVHPGATSPGSGVGITIAGNATSQTSLHFSSDTDNNVGEIKYAHSTDVMHFYTSGAEQARINSTGLTVIGALGVGITASASLQAHFYRNTADAQTQVYIEQDNASGTGIPFWIQNDGTGNGVFIDQNGNGTALYIDSEATTGNDFLIESQQTTGITSRINLNGTTNGSGQLIYSNYASMTGQMYWAWQANASSTATPLRITNDGIGNGIVIDQNGNGIALNIDSESTGAALIIDSNGQTLQFDNTGLGIGAAPSYPLDVIGNVNGTYTVRVGNSNTGASAVVRNLWAVGSRYVISDISYAGQFLSETGSNILTRYHNYDTHIWRNNAGTEQARLNSSGLGIGGAPSATLDIHGDYTAFGGQLVIRDSTAANAASRPSLTLHDNGTLGTGSLEAYIGKNSASDQILTISNWINAAINFKINADATTVATLDASGLDVTGEITVTGSISDEYGDVRSVPSVGTKTTAYTLQAADAGRYVRVDSGGSITIPNSVFSQGDVVTIIAGATTATITCGTTNSFITGDATNQASVTLAERGICTLLFHTGTSVYMSGNLS